MFRFEDPIYLWLLLIIPVLLAAHHISNIKRAKRLRTFGDIGLLKNLMPDVSVLRHNIKAYLLLIALSLVIIVLARPQLGSKISHEKRNGIEAIIAVDISNSMLAQDVMPSRLDKSKLLIENLIESFTNDKIGLIVFAGDAFVQLPITSDYVSAKMFLQSIDPAQIEAQGTDITKALNLSMNSFTQQKNIGKAIILITDGENHEGNAMEMARKAYEKGIRVYILGIGDTKGSPIPLSEGGYLTDNNGQTVMTALNEQMCKDIAQAGNGMYIHVDNTNDAQKRLNDELAKLQKGDTESVIYSEYAEQFQAVCIIILILLILEVCLLEVQNSKLKKMNLFSSKRMIVLAFMLSSLSVMAQSDRQFIRNGNKQYRSQDYQKSEVEYRKAISKNSNNSNAIYNLGCALMMQQKDSAAIVHFQQAGNLEKNKMRKAMSYHNIGVICQKHQMYGDAINAYKEALRNNPNDDETRYNLALCKRLNKENPDKNKQNQDKNKKENKQEQNKKDNSKQKDKQEKQAPQPKEQMSRENAEQLLNAAIQEEKATQQRLKKATQRPNKQQNPKNW